MLVTLISHDYATENEIATIAVQNMSKCIFNIFKYIQYFQIKTQETIKETINLAISIIMFYIS